MLCELAHWRMCAKCHEVVMSYDNFMACLTTVFVNRAPGGDNSEPLQCSHQVATQVVMVRCLFVSK